MGFPRTWLGCSLLLRIQEERIKQHANRWRWLKVGKDSQYSESVFLLAFWSLELNMVPLLEQWEGIGSIMECFKVGIGKASSEIK